MKKIFINICILWLLIAFFSPLIIAPIIKSQLLQLTQNYPEVDIQDYQKGYFSSKIRMRVSIPQLGLIHESDEKIIHSPLLFSGLSWLKIDGQDIKAKLNLSGKIYAQIRPWSLIWNSNIFSHERGELTINRFSIPIENGNFQLNDPWIVEVSLKDKKVLTSEFSGRLTYNKQTYLISGKDIVIQKNREKIHFEAQEINLNLGVGKPQALSKVKGVANYQQQLLEASFLTKLTFPLLALNQEPTFIKIENNILEINNQNNLNIKINTTEQRGYAILKSQFAHKNHLLLLIKYKFGELSQTKEKDYWLPFLWNKEGLWINGKFII